MQKWANSYINKAILQCLLNGQEIKRGRKVIGYGLNSLNFEKRKVNLFGLPEEIQLSRKLFRKHSVELIRSCLITQIKTKNKKANIFSITPIGICELYKNSLYDEDLTTQELDRIWIILLQFGLESDKKNFGLDYDYNEMIEFLEKYSKKEFKFLLDDIVKFYRDDSMDLIFRISDDTHFRLANIQLYDKEIILNESSSTKKEHHSLTVEQFHSYIADFILFSIIYGAIYHDYLGDLEFKSETFNKRKFVNKSIRKKIDKTFDKLLPRIKVIVDSYLDLKNQN